LTGGRHRAPVRTLEGLVNIGLTLSRAVAIVFWWQRVFGL